MKKPIQINCLGRLEIYFNGVEQSMYMNSNKARELIAYLVTYQGAPVPKENVCTALWGEIPLQYSRDCLYKLLGKIQNIDIPFHIEKRRGIIQLHMDNISSDIVKFKDLVSQTDDINKMEEIIDLYSGSLFEEESYNWASMKSAQYDKKYIDIIYYLQNYYESNHMPVKSNFYTRLMDQYK